MEMKKRVWKRKYLCGSSYAVTTICRTHICWSCSRVGSRGYPLNITGCSGVGMLDLLTEVVGTCMIFLRKVLTNSGNDLCSHDFMND